MQMRRNAIARPRTLAEDGVVVVEVRMLRVRDEKLAAIRVRARIGHREDAACRVRVLGPQLIVEFSAPNRLATLAAAGRVAALQHEALHVAVEERAVIVP